MSIERDNFKRTFRIEISLLVVFILAFSAYVTGLIPLGFRTELLGTIALIGLIPVALSAGNSLLEKKISVDLLASIALFFSLVAHEWGSVLFINMMLSSARILDLYTKRRVHNSLQSLLKLKPLKARVLHGEEAIDTPLSKVCIGDLIFVNLGEQVPVDGRVIKGTATLDQSSLTGESVPVLLGEGDRILAATMVVSGNIVVRAEKIGAETTFERMIKLVERSQSAKTRVKTLVERFASWYISIMLVVSIVLYAVTRDTNLVLAVILVVCADDIAVAIPLAYIAAMGTAARRGILIKSADFLERATTISTLIVDKTGTLTIGRLMVQNTQAFNGTELNRVFELAGSMCGRSTHPVSKAIVRYAKEKGTLLETPKKFDEFEGRGIVGRLNDNQEIVLGRLEFLEERGITIDDKVHTAINEAKSQGNNTTLVACAGNVVGLFSLADEVRKGVAETITALKKGGIKEIIMLTGDNEAVAKSIAKHAGIDKYYAGLLPEHKVFVLKDYLGKHDRTVAMMGDGVNDAAVLTRSDIGIAMGGIGSDAAIDSADIVLMNDDFPKLLDLCSISRKVRAVVSENFTIWALVNILGLFLVFKGVLDPEKAAAYNFITDFIPIMNALRLYRYR